MLAMHLCIIDIVWVLLPKTLFVENLKVVINPDFELRVEIFVMRSRM